MDKKPISDRDIDLTKLDGLELDDEKQSLVAEPIAIVNSAPDPEKNASEKKSKKKITIVVSIIGMVLVVVGVLTWLFQFKGIYMFQGLPLEKYSNSIYSVSKPIGYKILENNITGSNADVTFINPEQDKSSMQSKVYITSNQIDSVTKQKYLDQLDSTYSNNNIEQSKKSVSGFRGQANIKYSKANYRGFESRRIDYDIAKGSERIGRYSKLSLFKDGKIYEIIVSATSSDPGLVVDIDKIFTSFSLK